MSFEDSLPDTLKIRRVQGPSLSVSNVRSAAIAEETHRRFQYPAWTLVLISFALVGVLQWLPFGWNISPRVDGWTLLTDVDSGLTPFIYISPDLVTRPFFFWIWILNHQFDQTNFVLLNVILMIMQIVRGMALYALIRQLFPKQMLFAYLSGALLMVFPADSGTYYEGATHVLLSLTLQLVAVNVLVWYWRDGAWWRLALALLLEVISVGNYEIGNLLYFAVPLLLWWLHKHITRRLLFVTLLWYVAPGLSIVVAYVDVYFNPASHHSTMLEASGVPYTQKLTNAIQVQYWTAYMRGYTQMYNALTGTSAAARSNLYAALGITLIATITAILLRWWKVHENGAGHPMTAIQWLLVSLAGFFAMLLGIALFLPSDQLDSFAVYQPVRLFYFSAAGAVLTLVALAFALDHRLRLRGLLASALIICVIAGGSMSLMTQHQEWRDASWQQQHLIGSMLRQTGHIQDGTLVFVIDRSNGDLANYFPFNYQFEAAFQLITDNYSLKARLCYDDDTEQADTFYCHFGTKSVQVPDIWVGGASYTYPYSRVIGFLLEPDGSVTMLKGIPTQFAHATGYNPQDRYDLSAGLPPRYYTMLTYFH